MNLGRRLRHFSLDLSTQLERGKYFYLLNFSIVFIGLTALRALARPLWYDELFTYYMSRLPGLASTWSALKDGADLNPPLLYLATRAAQRVFGNGLIATRLPAILGFLTMLLCVFRFTAVRCGAGFGFAAMLFTALSGAYTFAYEARSYGMVLGFCGLSLVAWQMAAAEGRSRRFAIPLLCLSVAGALLSHCYAVLILIPLAAGEIIRSLDRKKLDWPIWIALTAASCPVLIYLPLLAAKQRLVLDNVTFRPTLRVLIDSYGMLAAPLAAPLIVALVIIVATRPTAAPAKIPNRAGEPSGFRLHEIGAAFGLILIPLFAFLVAKFVSNIFMARYGIAAAVGFSILFARFAHRYAGDRRVAGAMLPIVFAAWFVSSFALWMLETAHSHVSAASKPASAPHAYEIPPQLVNPDLPFVAANGLFFLEADHYAPDAFVSRLFYLADPRAAVRYTGSDVFDKGFRIMQKWFPIRARVEDYGPFVGRNKRFLVFGEFDHPLGWLTKRLLDDGARLRFLGQYHGAYGENLLLEVTMPDVQPALPPER